MVGEDLIEGSVGLGVCSKVILEDLELCVGGALANLDLVGLVGAKGVDVDELSGVVGGCRVWVHREKVGLEHCVVEEDATRKVSMGGVHVCLYTGM